jgi:hypothetical protein
LSARVSKAIIFYGKTPDPRTGIYYGSIYGTHVSPEALDVGGPDWKDESWAGYIEELGRQLEKLIVSGQYSSAEIADIMYFTGNEEALEELAEIMGENEDGDEDEYDGPLLFLNEGELDYLIELITRDATIDSTAWSLDDGDYQILYDSNDNDISVLKSPYVAFVREASPCFNGGYLEANSSANMWAYCLGPEFFDEYNPCPYVPVKLSVWQGMSDKQRARAEDAACEFGRKWR